MTHSTGQIDRSAALDDIVRRIVAQFSPEKVILFGSTAKGTDTPDSDLDLLVVINVEGSKRSLANDIDLALADRTIPLDLILLTPEQFERQKQVIGALAYQAMQEGKVVYDHAA